MPGMGPLTFSDASIDGNVYIQKLAAYIKRNEEALANGLLFLTSDNKRKYRPARLAFTTHHLYFITEKIQLSGLGVDVGPLNIKMDNPNHEPTFISFMAANALNARHFDSDTRSISSINSVRSIMTTASAYWQYYAFSQDPKVLQRNLKYLYSSFTKIPCLSISPSSKVASISEYEQYPCDTSVPITMFKNLQVLEVIDYDPNEIFGWHVLSENLRILIIRSPKVTDAGEVLFNLVVDDQYGRSSFNDSRTSKKEFYSNTLTRSVGTNLSRLANDERHKRGRASSECSSVPTSQQRFSRPYTDEPISSYSNRDYHNLPDGKWAALKQLTITSSTIKVIPSYVFKPLRNIVTLNLSNNLLEAVPEGLEQLDNLKYLDLSDNYITGLKNIPANMKHLRTLRLSNNKIKSLDGIQNLSVLESVDLCKNELTDMRSLKPLVLYYVKNSSHLSSIYLRNNKLPKNYRIELFNLLCGVQSKNKVKIDDSRPGYFESALLLDSRSAKKALYEYLGVDHLYKLLNCKMNTTPREEGGTLKQGVDYILNSFPSPDPDTPSGREKPRKFSDMNSSPSGLPDITSRTTNSQLRNNLPPMITALSNASHASLESSYASPLMQANPVEAKSSSVPKPLSRSTTLRLLDMDRTSSSNATSIISPVQVTGQMTT